MPHVHVWLRGVLAWQRHTHGTLIEQLVHYLRRAQFAAVAELMVGRGGGQDSALTMRFTRYAALAVAIEGWDSEQ